MASASDKSGASANSADVVLMRRKQCDRQRGISERLEQIPDCGLSAGFDDNAGNADGAGDARGYRASG